ncbi:glycosyltransferase family 4 protein [Pengzhenrongella phosphoraccumulans]|uniref:glycosyltransferase family 4 protein n=1 Tax=Pengzhenrongella phosphoraccumulans TaxID=3114394 RepID=UPI00388F3C82
MRITLDATPLLGPRTGVGRYTEHLIAALPAALRRRGIEPQVRVSTWTARGGRLTDLPDDVTQVGPRVPARLLREAWRRVSFPPIEALVGTTEVFHGTNFVSPPTRHAREVVTIHDLTYELLSGTVSSASLMYRELVPKALKRGALVVTPTHAIAAAVRAHYGLPAERVHVTPLGVDATWFAAAGSTPTWLSRRALPHDYFVFVGALDPRKNLPRLLAAHQELRAADSGAPDLVLAGPAGRETRLAEQPGVHVTGWLEDDELRSLVAGSRALVLPSIDEGFGLPVLEALATGRPVVISDLPVLREVTGSFGIAAPPTDVAALAGAMAQALTAPDDETARTARRDWAGRFTWEACADSTIDAYLAPR